MRIVLLTAIPLWHPGTSELIQFLRKENYSIVVIDIFHGRMLDQNNEIVNLLPFNIKGLLSRVYLFFFRRSFIKKNIQNEDILDIHFVEPYYSKYLNNLPNKLICTLFGSDLFRTNDIQKKMQRPLFEKCDRIVLSKNMVPYFEEHFGQMNHKYYFNQYGSNKIDEIIQKKSTFSNKETKLKLKIPEDKIVVTCGYNNKKEQQHLSIVEQLNKLPDNIKDKIFLIFPMTYGDVERSYIEDVKNELTNSRLPYLVFESKLSNKEIIDLRLISDITINTQTTDALASSIKEAFVADDLVLLGDWLPYDIYEELGVVFEKINFENLTEKLKNNINSIESIKSSLTVNEYIIANFASWNVLIENWKNQYIF